MKSLLSALVLSTASLVAITAAAPLSAQEQVAEAADVAAYKEIREDIWQWTLDNSPGTATTVGDRRGDGKLGDLSLAGYDKQIAESRAFVQRLDAIDQFALPTDLQVDLAIVRQSLADDIAASAFDHSRYILFTNRGGWFQSLSSLPYRSPFFTLADYESYVARLEAYPAFNADGIARSREAVARGLTQPCEPMVGFVDRVSSQIADDPATTPFWLPFAERPSSVSASEWTALQDRARVALTDGVFPAFQEFVDFYEADYAPKCRTGTPGILETPNGEDYYAYRVKSFHHHRHDAG